MATLSTLSNPYCQHCHCHYHHFSGVNTDSIDSPSRPTVSIFDILYIRLIFKSFVGDFFIWAALLEYIWATFCNFKPFFFLFSSSIYFDHREGILMGSVWLFFGGCDWKITWFHPSPHNTTSRTFWNCDQSKIHFFTNCLTVILNYQIPYDYEALEK